MSDRNAFLAAIIEQPEQDLPRLIYADYLDDGGESARAEFIRLQCAAAHGDQTEHRRIAQLEDAHRSEWLAPLGRGVYHAVFRRGFPEHLVMSARNFIEDNAEIREHTPVRGVALLGAGRVLARLLAGPHLAGLTALHLTGGMLGDAGVERLTECVHLAGMRTLRLGMNEIGDAGAAALADCPYLEELRLLVLSQNAIGDAGAWELARSAYFRQLVGLDLNDNDISPMSLAMMRNSPFLENLSEFEANNQRATVRWRLPALSASKSV
jgi:uncharacterized protein (TIGR02996 family)